MWCAMRVPQRAGADLRLLRAAVFSAVCVALSATAHVVASGAGLPLWSLLSGWAIVLCAVVPLAARERTLPGIALVLLVGELSLHSVFCFAQSGMSATSGSSPNAAVALAERMLCGPGVSHLTPQSAAAIIRRAGLDPASAAALLRRLRGTSGMSQMAASSTGFGASTSTGTGTGTHAMSLASMFTPSMLAAHLAAALVAGWLLRRGEVALWRIVRLEALVVERVTVLSRLAALLATAFIVALVADVLEKCLSTARRGVRTSKGDGRLESALLAHSLLRRGPPAAVLTA